MLWTQIIVKSIEYCVLVTPFWNGMCRWTRLFGFMFLILLLYFEFFDYFFFFCHPHYSFPFLLFIFQNKIRIMQTNVWNGEDIHDESFQVRCWHARRDERKNWSGNKSKEKKMAKDPLCMFYTLYNAWVYDIRCQCSGTIGKYAVNLWAMSAVIFRCDTKTFRSCIKTANNINATPQHHSFIRFFFHGVFEIDDIS